MLGFTDEQLNDFAFEMLPSLGFTRKEIEAANIHICGAMTLEGAPFLQARSTIRCSTAPRPAARSASVRCRPNPTSA